MSAHKQQEIVASVWQVNGHPTEVLKLPATNDPPDVQLLIIAGNPGAAPFYTPFLRQLSGRLGGRAAVTAISNLGMDGQGLTPPGRVFSLEEQVQHKAALLRERFVGAGRPPLVLLGHSIGAYMAVHAVHQVERGQPGTSRALAQALDSTAARAWDGPAAGDGPHPGCEAGLKGLQAQLVAELEQQRGGQEPERQAVGGEGSDEQREQSNVVKVVGLFPFLQVDPDCSRQRRLAWLTRHHALASRLAGGLGALPLGWRRGLVRAFAGGMDAHAVDTAAQVFAAPTCVANGLYMGLTEFEALSAPADWWMLQRLGPRLAVFAAPNDTWFKKWKWDALHREVRGVESYWLDSQTHAFCVSERQSAELAAHVAPLVEAALPAPSRL